jgi:hypothetical protein
VKSVERTNVRDGRLLIPSQTCWRVERAEFSTWTPHWFGVIEEPVEAIMIFGVHGERLHLHT